MNAKRLNLIFANGTGIIIGIIIYAMWRLPFEWLPPLAIIGLIVEGIWAVMCLFNEVKEERNPSVDAK